MQILRLEAENLKRIKVVEITPDGELVVIAGKNGQGKTSVLDSIMLALAGKKAQSDVAPDPIRHGEETAHVTLDMGELIVTRKWEGEKTSLVVTNGEGAKFSRPQEMLDALLGSLSFDPLEFANQLPRQQREMLLRIVPLAIDLDALAAARAKLYDTRVSIGRQGKAEQAAFDLKPKPQEGLPEEQIDASAISADLGEVRRHERAYRDLEARLVNAQARADRAREELRLANQDVSEISTSLDGMEEPRDPDDLIAALAEVSATNEAIAYKNAFISKGKVVADLRTQYEQLTGEIGNLDTTKAEALKAAKMPIEGLSFTDDGVTYNGVPFEQCSGAERLRVSMAVAMAQNPRLRVLRITDGSLLDSDNLTLVGEMAAEHDFQVWVERVGDGDGIGVVIEDGMVRGA